MRRRAGEKKKRKQATDVEEARCCPSAVVQGVAQRKNEGECPGKLGLNPNGVGDRTTTLRRLLIGAAVS